MQESSLLQHVNSFMAVFSDSCREFVLQYSPWEHHSVCPQRNSTPVKTKATQTDHINYQKEEFGFVSIIHLLFLHTSINN